MIELLEVIGIFILLAIVGTLMKCLLMIVFGAIYIGIAKLLAVITSKIKTNKSKDESVKIETISSMDKVKGQDSSKDTILKVSSANSSIEVLRLDFN